VVPAQSRIGAPAVRLFAGRIKAVEPADADRLGRLIAERPVERDPRGESMFGQPAPGGHRWHPNLADADTGWTGRNHPAWVFFPFLLSSPAAGWEVTPYDPGIFLD
jgi:hypothetical protein